jgi:hypothetical protein
MVEKKVISTEFVRGFSLPVGTNVRQLVGDNVWITDAKGISPKEEFVFSATDDEVCTVRREGCDILYRGYNIIDDPKTGKWKNTLIFSGEDLYTYRSKEWRFYDERLNKAGDRR